MKTRKPVSTVTYNTTDFLVSKLNMLLENCKIQYYMFIIHEPEEDESKKHIHLYIEPNGQIDTMKITEVLTEFDPGKPDKPLKPQPWRYSKTDKEGNPDDWILYNLHDKKYLAWKGQSRKYHYQEEQFICSDSDYCHDIVYHAYHYSSIIEEWETIKAIRESTNTADLFYSGRININQILNVSKLKELEDRNGTYRNGKPNHE